MKSTTKMVSRVLALGSSLIVAAALAATAVPQVSVTATDKGYSIPAQVTGGTVHLSLKNSGAAPHGVEIFKLKARVSSDMLKKAVADFALKGDEAAGPMVAAEFYGGVPDVEPIGQGDGHVTLDPGEYALVSTTFAVALPTDGIAPGKHSWEVLNTGSQPHFLFVARVQGGA